MIASLAALWLKMDRPSRSIRLRNGPKRKHERIMQASTESLPTPPSGVKYIPLTKGKFAIVDEGDYEYISQWKWCENMGYAMRRALSDGKPRMFLMHAVINRTPIGLSTDHINMDGLDNRRSNLRTAEHCQNLWNAGKKKNNTSGFKGVSWDSQRGKFLAQIVVRRKTITLGRFEHPEDAAGIYLTAAIEYHGQFARA